MKINAAGGRRQKANFKRQKAKVRTAVGAAPVFHFCLLHFAFCLLSSSARLFGLARIRYTWRDLNNPAAGKPLMSELKERRWAVLSERGREEAGLSYEEAAGLIARLRGERLSGLCVITDEAASHLPAAAKKTAAGSSSEKSSSDNSKGAPAASRPRRSRKKDS
jgi:hypothetical protein